MGILLCCEHCLGNVLDGAVNQNTNGQC